MSTQEIDFVILWVDGGDPAWRSLFAEAKAGAGRNADVSEIRYRDWDNLRYWFRAAERFAPWVRRIHFVTWGHLPSWLDTSHPKLNIVRHEDFIPREYLPTFNSNVIELNLGNIEGLAERFVLFNDDMFLLRDCRPEDFFRGGLPCDMARLSVVQPSSVGHIVYNNLEIVNAACDKRTCVRRNLGKWLNLRYGAGNVLKTLTLMPWSMFTGFWDSHQPQPHLASDFRRAWELWGGRLDAVCRNRFRELTDVSHWLMRYVRLAEGRFVPRGMGDCRLLTVCDASAEDICRDIESGRWRMACLNDSEDIGDFEAVRDRLKESFERLLPKKSEYEKL